MFCRKPFFRYKLKLSLNKFIHQIIIKDINSIKINSFYEKLFKNVHIYSAGIGFLVSAEKTDNGKADIRKIDFSHSEFKIEQYTIISKEINFKNIRHISCGRDHCMILTCDDSYNSIYSSGCNTFGQCGSNESTNWLNVHKISTEKGTIKQLECGLDHSLILNNDGEIFSCGLGTDGQTGLKTFKNTFQFQKVEFPHETTVVKKISCCADTVLALTEYPEKTIYGWGNNEYGQLMGVSKEEQVIRPTVLLTKQMLSSFGPINDILAIGSMCFMVTNENELYGWGYGQLNQSPIYSTVPTKINLIGADGQQIKERIIKLCGSVHYGMVITESNRLFIIGDHHGLLNQIDSHSHKCHYYHKMSNEIVLDNVMNQLCCGLDRIFLQFKNE